MDGWMDGVTHLHVVRGDERAGHAVVGQVHGGVPRVVGGQAGVHRQNQVGHCLALAEALKITQKPTAPALHH